MNRVIIFIGIFFLSNSLFSQTVTKLTLQEAIKTALANNVQVRQGDVQVQVAEVGLKQSRADILPNLNGAVSHGINRGRSIDPFTNTYVDQQVAYANYGLGSSVVLFNGLSLQNSIKQNAFALEASKMELQQLKDQLTINVILAYLQVLNNQDLIELSKGRVDVTRKQVDRLNVLNENGAIDPPQLHELRGQLMEEELTVVTGQNALETSKLVLAQLMNVTYNRAMSLEDIDINSAVLENLPTSGEVYGKAVDQLAFVKAAELRRKSFEAALKSVRGELFPTVRLNGNVNSNYSSAAMRNAQKIPYNDQLQNNLFSNVNIGIQFPIFNSWRTRNRIRLVELDIQNSMLLEENTKVQLRQEVEQAHLNMTNAFERLQILQKQVGEFAESFRAAEVRFNAGVGTSIDYLLAKNNYDRAAMNLLIAKYDVALRKRILDYYTTATVR